MKSFTGVIQRGSKRATELGYPTINLTIRSGEVSGVFAARVWLADGPSYAAAAFSDAARGVLEAHMLDFDGDLYGEVATIELGEKIRETKKFDTDGELKAAIAADVAAVRRNLTH